MFQRIKTISPFGLRTLKTLIALLLCVLLMEYVFNDIPFFACIGAVVAVEKTIPKSIQASISRNLGTIVGGVLGIIFASITKNEIFLTFGIIPLIYIINIIGKRESIVAGAIVYFAVVYLNYGGEAAALYGFRRIMWTLLGSFIGIAVNLIIFPPKEDIV